MFQNRLRSIIGEYQRNNSLRFRKIIIPINKREKLKIVLGNGKHLFSMCKVGKNNFLKNYENNLYFEKFENDGEHQKNVLVKFLAKKEPLFCRKVGK